MLGHNLNKKKSNDLGCVPRTLRNVPRTCPQTTLSLKTDLNFSVQKKMCQLRKNLFNSLHNQKHSWLSLDAVMFPLDRSPVPRLTPTNPVRKPFREVEIFLIHVVKSEVKACCFISLKNNCVNLDLRTLSTVELTGNTLTTLWYYTSSKKKTNKTIFYDVL